VEGVVCLGEVNEDLKEGGLLYAGQLLMKFVFNNGCAGASLCPETMENIMELDCICNLCVNYGFIYFS
jgi:hypothetical protein